MYKIKNSAKLNQGLYVGVEARLLARPDIRYRTTGYAQYVKLR